MVRSWGGDLFLLIIAGIAMLYVFFYWGTLTPLEGPSFLRWTHRVAAVSPWIGSSLYHLFMNHRGGSQAYAALLQLDTFGIWVTQSVGMTQLFGLITILKIEFLVVLLENS